MTVPTDVPSEAEIQTARDVLAHLVDNTRVAKTHNAVAWLDEQLREHRSKMGA